MSNVAKKIGELEWEEAWKRPGKFEGESLATVYFYEAWLDGDGEDLYFGGDTVEITLFEATPEERELLGAKTGKHWFAIQESDQGFVSGEWVSSAQANKWLTEDGEMPSESEEE